VAVSCDGQRWFLINASPDIREQLGAFPPLHPSAAPIRNSPLEAILLTNADLDHVAGILFLREGDPLHLHTSAVVRECLMGSLGFARLLDAFCGVVWHETPLLDWAPLPLRDGSASSLAYRVIPLPSPPPVFDSATHGTEPTMAFLIKDEQTGGVLLVAPDVSEVTPALANALQGTDAVLFDGTFWSEDELGNVRTGGRRAAAMGHLPIQKGSLDVLARCPARRRIYLHMNNTNPILKPDSPERKTVESAGIEIAHDGMELEL
jgi:pyrroloquinoline quinone biosynthesis protein B